MSSDAWAQVGPDLSPEAAEKWKRWCDTGEVPVHAGHTSRTYAALGRTSPKAGPPAPARANPTTRLGHEALRQRYAVDDPCDIAPGQHDEAVLVAWAHHEQRHGEPCYDCAFRLGSPEIESGEAMGIAGSGVVFRCHQGMPVLRREDGSVKLGCYAPDDPTRYPPCMGLCAMRKGRAHGATPMTRGLRRACSGQIVIR